LKIVHYTDKNGYLHAAQLRDNDPESMAPYGIPLEPPDLQLDWEYIRREVHNELVRRGLFTWKDVERQQTGITSALQSVLKRSIVALYRNEEIGRRAEQRMDNNHNSGGADDG